MDLLGCNFWLNNNLCVKDFVCYVVMGGVVCQYCDLFNEFILGVLVLGVDKLFVELVFVNGGVLKDDVCIQNFVLLDVV